MKRVPSVFLVLLLGFGLVCAAATAAVAATTAPTVVLDGKELSFEVPPVIEDGRTLVPLRAIFEALGATVKWDDTTKGILATRGDLTVNLTVGSPIAYKNGDKITLEVPAKIVEGRTLVPLRFVGESLGCQVDWDVASATVTITDPNVPKPKEVVKNDKIRELIVHPENFTGYPADLYGQVCRGPEAAGDGATGYLVWLDPDKKTINAYVVVPSRPAVEINDYVHFQGTITGKYDPPNYYVLHGIYVKADSIARATANDVLGPAYNTLTPNASAQQEGLAVTVTRVEFNEAETRLYLDIRNNSTSPAHIYDVQLLQGSRQFAQQHITAAGYQEMQSELFHDEETLGYLSFDPVDSRVGSLQVIVSCSVNDEDQKIEIGLSWQQ